MPEYMLLLHEELDLFKNYSPTEMQKVCEQYGAWARSLGKQGKLAGGQKLKDDGGRSLVRKKGKTLVHDGPYSETKEIIGGYFAIKAKNYEEALEIAKDCPHLEYGGRVEVRQVDEV